MRADRAVMSFDDTPGDREPQPRAGTLTMSRLPEPVEDVRQVLRTHSRSAVTNGEANIEWAIGVRRHVYSSTGRCEFYRVSDEIAEHLLQPLAICHHVGQMGIVGATGKLYICGGSGWRHCFECVCEQHFRRDRFTDDGESPRFDS